MEEVLPHDGFIQHMNYSSSTTYHIGTYSKNDTKWPILLDSLIHTGLITSNSIFTPRSSFFISFDATSVEKLPHFIQNNSVNKNNALNMIHCLNIQLKYIQTKGYSVYGFDIDDIYIIDKHVAFFVNAHRMVPYCNNHMIITEPITLPQFVDPSIKYIDTLPSPPIHINCIYYALINILIYLLTTRTPDLEPFLEKIKYTKMYYFMKRCINPDIPERTIFIF